MEPQAEAASTDRHRRWPTVVLAVLVALGGLWAWVATRPATMTACTLAGYLATDGADGFPLTFASADEAFAWWWAEGGGASGASDMTRDRSGRYDPQGGQPVTPTTVVPERDDFERRGDDWVWEYDDGLQIRVQLEEQAGRWTIVGVNQCSVTTM